MIYSEEIDNQTRIRIQIAKAAYAYEVNDDPIIDDAVFDTLCRKVDVNIRTRRPDLDEFFRNEFSPETGRWIWKHPDFDKIGSLVNGKVI